jgi:hypothetical protein
MASRLAPAPPPQESLGFLEAEAASYRNAAGDAWPVGCAGCGSATGAAGPGRGATGDRQHQPALGLPSALVTLADRFGQQADLTIERESERELPQLSKEQELVIYRVAQEALTNVARSGTLGGEVVLLPP